MSAFLWPYGKCLKCRKRNECQDSQAAIISCIGNGYPDFAPQTNYQRLTHMSMEELAKLFSGWIQDCGCNSVPCKDQCKKDRDSDEVKPCADYWLDWLRQEAQDES